MQQLMVSEIRLEKHCLLTASGGIIFLIGIILDIRIIEVLTE